MKTIPNIVPPSALLNATTLYDFFMNLIEPDLVSDNLPILDIPYVGETQQERARRHARYTASFQRCKDVMKEFVKSTERDAKKVIQRMDTAVEAEEAVGILASLSQTIQKL